MARFSPQFLLLLSLSAFGQQASLTQPALPPIPGPANVPAASTPEAQVTLEVQVTDKSGAPVRGLQKQDFTLLDNKQAQEIKLFHPVDRAAPAPGDPPVELILVVDAINASVPTVADERKWLKTFFLQNNGKLAQPVSLIFFYGAGKTEMSPPSRDGKALAALIEHTELGVATYNLTGAGPQVALERFDLGVKTMNSIATYQEKRPGRKLMIWISPGWPLINGPNLQLSTKEYQWIFDSIVGISTALRQAHITLNDVDPLGVSNAGGARILFYQDYLKGVISPSHAQPADLGLQVIASQTGGRVLNASNDLAAEIAECAADADAYYILSFKAPVAAAHAIEYHPIELTTAKPGAMTRTRSGYYAQP